MSNTNFAESISTSITNIITNVVTAAQNFMWNATKLNAKLWIWMPQWLEITILVIALITLGFLMRHAWKHREFWQELVDGKI